MLTEMGDDLATVVVAMLWRCDRWLALPGAPLSRMVEAATGHPVATLGAMSGGGRRLGRTGIGLACGPNGAGPA